MIGDSLILIIAQVLVVMLSIAPVPCMVATAYLWSVYRADPARPRSWLLRMLAVSSTVVTISVIYVAFLALYRLLGLGSLPDALVFMLAVDLLTLAAVPVYGALRIYRAAHGGSRPTIPTNGDPAYVRRDRERDKERDPMRDAARDADRDTHRDEGRDEIRDPARDAARDEEDEEHK